MRKSWMTISALGAVLAFGPAARAASDSVITSWPAPAQVISGLAYGDNTIFLSDPLNNVVYRIDPITHSVIGSFAPVPPGAGISGLSYDGGYLWAVTGYDRRLYKMTSTVGSIVASWPLTAISMPNCLGTDAGFAYISNYDQNAPYIYKLIQATGSIVQTWTTSVHTKYPYGLDVITRVPSNEKVIMNCGNIDGWVYFYDINGNRFDGEEFKIDAPVADGHFAGDLATKDDTHFYFACVDNGYVYEMALDWYEQEYPAVAPASFGKIKALYR